MIWVPCHRRLRAPNRAQVFGILAAFVALFGMASAFVAPSAFAGARLASAKAAPAGKYCALS